MWQGWSRFSNDHGAKNSSMTSLTGNWGWRRRSMMKTSSASGGLASSPSPSRTVNKLSTMTVLSSALVVARSLTCGARNSAWMSRCRCNYCWRTVYKRQADDGVYPGCDSDAGGLCDEFPDPGPDVSDALQRRAVGLQTGNPGFPGYRHGGYLLGAGVELQWLFWGTRSSRSSRSFCWRAVPSSRLKDAF